nr:unnamed protein product [Callosobruchus analis]
MIDLLQSLKTVVHRDQINIDNNVFKLHYKVTVIMLLTFTVLLSSKQYFGDPIDCDVKERKETIQTFCWIFGTFINKDTVEHKTVPGLGLEGPNSTSRQVYYQWICIVFGIQSALFYLPRYLWKAWEGGRLRLLVEDLSGPLISSNWNNTTRDKLVRCLLTGSYFDKIYAVRFCFCEILNFVHVVAQIYFMDWFITGNFISYGISHASYSTVNPMNVVFPKIAKCTYHKFGYSGSEVNIDALCVLPLNVLNEKLFLVLWYWLFFLLTASFFAVMYRALFLFSHKVRVYLLRAQTRNLDHKKAEIIVDNLSYGDFFLMYKIGKNINPIIYREFVLAVYENIPPKRGFQSDIVV